MNKANQPGQNPDIEIIELANRQKGLLKLLECFYSDMILEGHDDLFCTREYEEMLSDPYVTIIDAFKQSAETLQRIYETCNIELLPTASEQEEV